MRNQDEKVEKGKTRWRIKNQDEKVEEEEEQKIENEKPR